MELSNKFGRFCWRHCIVIVSAVIAGAIIAVAAVAYCGLGADATFNDRAQITENTLLALGLLSVILLVAQLRQTTSWNRVLAYHNYFGELPSEDRANQLFSCLSRLKIAVPTSSKPLSKDQAKTLWADTGVVGRDGIPKQIGQRVVREYLNDFEEFCGAVRAEVLNEKYVRELEGDRTINAYYGFREVIRITQQEAVDFGRSEQDGDEYGSMARKLQGYRRKPYHELRLVATAWRACREKEYQKLAKKRKSILDMLAKEDNSGGVGPST